MADGGEAKPWHGPDGRFCNPPGSPVNGGTRAEWWAFAWRRFREGRHPPPGLPPELVLPPEAVRRGMADLGGADGITWLGHACFLIHLAGRRLLTDPFLSDYASPYRWLGPHRHTPPALRAPELPPVDAVLLSHAHYDHLDLPALAALPGKESAALVTGLGMGRYLAGLGFARLVELDWHETATLAGLEVTALPAIHFNRRTARDRNRALWCGFVAAGGGRRVHFAGDTAYGPVFKEVGRRYPGPDMALVPIGAYEPRHLMRGVHCTPEDAAALGRDLRAKALCAMHWGAIKLTDEPPIEPPGRFRAAAGAAGYPPERALVLRVGETHRL
jgi:L-ascorbate metabolism protein UlaG (beta-lactamase superfamily)